MKEHSEKLLRGSNEEDASIAALQGKLQFSQMQISLDTQVFTARPEEVPGIVDGLCDLPGEVCRKIKALVVASDAKFHKKLSVPLDENKGSYVAVWMWGRKVSGGQYQVAFKGASLSYRLRDVVTYREQIVEEPTIDCTETISPGWFGSWTSKSCSQVGTSRTVSQIPVFKQVVMDANEMQLVDTLMERMLAKKALENEPSTGALASPPPSALKDAPPSAGAPAPPEDL